MAQNDTEPLPAPPYSSDLLADLHAGVLPESVSRRLWPLVRSNADAMVVIDALDALTAQLGDIGEDVDHGSPVPPHVVERIDRALSSEHTPAVVLPFERKRSRAVRIGVGAAATVALVAALSAVILPRLTDPTPDVSVAAEPSLVLDAGQVDSQLAFSIIGRREPGVLSDPARLAQCLQANGIRTSVPVLGSSDVEVDGRAGTLLVLPGDRPAALIALAVGSRCGQGVADTLARHDLN